MAGCVGVCGLHRFYLNSPLLGLIYLLSLGLLGMGQLLDVFFIPSLVESCNRGRLFYYASSSSNTNTATTDTTGPHYYSLGNHGGMNLGLGGLTFSFGGSGGGGGHHPYSNRNFDDMHQNAPSYVPPPPPPTTTSSQQSATSGDGNETEPPPPQEYIPPTANPFIHFNSSNHEGISLVVNGQTVDLSQGGTFFIDENGTIEGGVGVDDDDFDTGYTNNQIFEDQARRNREHLDRLNRQRVMEQNQRAMENQQRMTREANQRHFETMRRVNDMNMQSIRRMNEQNRNMMFQQNQRMQFQNNLNQTMRMNQMNNFNTFKRR